MLIEHLSPLEVGVVFDSNWDGANPSLTTPEHEENYTQPLLARVPRPCHKATNAVFGLRRKFCLHLIPSTEWSYNSLHKGEGSGVGGAAWFNFNNAQVEKQASLPPSKERSQHENLTLLQRADGMDREGLAFPEALTRFKCHSAAIPTVFGYERGGVWVLDLSTNVTAWNLYTQQASSGVCFTQ